MPWQERSIMSERQEFVAFARQEGATISALCARVWDQPQDRLQVAGARGGGRPGPGRSLAPTARLAGPDAPGDGGPHPGAAGRAPVLGRAQAASSAGGPGRGRRARAQHHHRHPAPPRAARPRAGPRGTSVRFEHPAPNELWQMDFMGHRALAHRPGPSLDAARRPFPLRARSDRLRQRATRDRQGPVDGGLSPLRPATGHPAPTMARPGARAGRGGLTRLEAWLLRLGVEPWHGRPAHPQTQGKVERFHGTIAAEVFAHRHLADLAEAQAHFDRLPHRATTTSARTRRSPTPCPPVATSPVRVPSQKPFPPSPTGRTRLCAPSPSMARSAGRGDATSSAAAWSASRSPCVPPGGGALGGRLLSSSGRHHRPPTTPTRCNLCPRTPVTHVSGLHRNEESRRHAASAGQPRDPHAFGSG